MGHGQKRLETYGLDNGLQSIINIFANRAGVGRFNTPVKAKQDAFALIFPRFASFVELVYCVSATIHSLSNQPVLKQHSP